MPIPPAFAHVPRCPPPLPLLEPSQSRLPLTSCCQTQRTLQWPWALAYRCNGDLSLLLGFLESGCLSDAPSQAHVGPPPPAVAPKCPLNGGVGQCSVPPPHPCGSCQHCANCTATHRSSQDVCDEPQTAWMYLFECLLPLAKTPPTKWSPQGSAPKVLPPTCLPSPRDPPITQQLRPGPGPALSFPRPLPLLSEACLAWNFAKTSWLSPALSPGSLWGSHHNLWVLPAHCPLGPQDAGCWVLWGCCVSGVSDSPGQSPFPGPV